MPTSTIQLTSEQQTCVAFDQRQHLLIRGPAGSGKTLVLLLRAHELASEHTEPVQFVTFATSLVSSARQLGAQVLPNGMGCDIRSYHSWCAQRLSRLGIHLTIAEAREQEQWLTDALGAVRQRTYDSASSVRENPAAWWRDEVAWIKGTLLPDGKPISSLEDYLGAARVGRGSALHPSARVIVWDVFTGYQQRMAAAGKVDWQDLTRTLLEHYRHQPLFLRLRLIRRRWRVRRRYVRWQDELRPGSGSVNPAARSMQCQASHSAAPTYSSAHSRMMRSASSKGM